MCEKMPQIMRLYENNPFQDDPLFAVDYFHSCSTEKILV